MGIFDIILIAIAVLALVVGLLKGGAGIFFGFIGTLIVAVVAAVGAVFIVPQVAYTNADVGFTDVAEENYGCSDLFYMLYEPISSSFVSSDDTLYNATFTANEGMVYGPFGEEGEEVEITLEEVITLAIPIDGAEEALSGVCTFIAGFISSGANEGVTVGQAIANLITKLAFGGIIWFIVFLVLFIIKRILRRVLFKALDTHPVASKIDRAIGAILLVAVVIVIAWIGVSYLESNKDAFSLSAELEELSSSNFTYKLFAEHNMFGTPQVDVDPPVDIPVSE